MDSFNVAAAAGAYQHPMERVLYNLHHKLCTIAVQRTSSKGRIFAERILLFIFLMGFTVTMIVHISFVHRDTMSLNGLPLQSIPLTCLHRIPGFSADADVTHVSLLEEENATSWAMTFNTGEQEQDCPADSRTPPTNIYFSYSKVQGYLLLGPELCAQHNLKVQHVAVAKTDERCFGRPLVQKLTFSLTGADTAMLNWILGAFHSFGFIYNPRTKNLLDLSLYSQIANDRHTTKWYQQIPPKTAIVVKTSFLFFIATTLVSFILRETQERMLEFTHQLQSRVRLRRPVGNLVVSHLVENLVFVPIMVGMIFFLIEIYRGDKVAAFMVLSIIWVCEAFSVISLRSSEGMHFFPRIFFLEFSIFHFYLFMFPFGFAYMALASTAVSMIYTMHFFWHRYELPALVNGYVTLDRPRMRSSPPRRDSDQPPNSDDDTDGVPRLPNVRLPRPMSRQSIGSSSQGAGGRVSRHSSSINMFHRADDDDTASSSYMFFMDGEVVMHGGRRSPSLPSAGSIDGEESSPAIRIPESISTQGIMGGSMINLDEPSVAEEATLPGTRLDQDDPTSPSLVAPVESMTPRAHNRANDNRIVDNEGETIPFPVLPEDDGQQSPALEQRNAS